MIKITKKLLFLLSIFLIAVNGFVFFSINEEHKSKIFFLDVGQGDAILIQKGNFQILVDGGRGDMILEELGKNMQFGDDEIEILLLTHPDEDHMGGLLKVLEKYKVEKVIESGVSCDKEICKKWRELIFEKNIETLNARLGQEVIFEDIMLSIIYPFSDISGESFSDLNDTSVVSAVFIDGKKYLLTGDIGKEAERSLIEKDININSDYLKISHHGSKNSSSYDFLREVSPDIAIISVGDNSYGHPSEEILNRLRNMNIEIFRTDEMGGISF